MDVPLTMTAWALLAALHAGLVEAHAQVLVDPVVRLLKADIQLVVRVVASLRALALWGSLERVPATKHLGEYVWHSSACERVALGRSVRVTELVKVLALLGVRQDVVCALDLLELLWIATLVGVRP
jgi:hypothetical protein